jgi:hypothetical protein
MVILGWFPHQLVEWYVQLAAERKCNFIRYATLVRRRAIQLIWRRYAMKKMDRRKLCHLRSRKTGKGYNEP